jgi:hypothetical protein
MLLRRVAFTPCQGPPRRHASVMKGPEDDRVKGHHHEQSQSDGMRVPPYKQVRQEGQPKRICTPHRRFPALRSPVVSLWVDPASRHRNCECDSDQGSVQHPSHRAHGGTEWRSPKSSNDKEEQSQTSAGDKAHLETKHDSPNDPKNHDFQWVGDTSKGWCCFHVLSIRLNHMVKSIGQSNYQLAHRLSVHLGPILWEHYFLSYPLFTLKA